MAKTQTAESLPPIPGGILNLAESRKNSALRELRDRHDLITGQLQRPPMFPSASWDTQRRNLAQALEDTETQISRIAGLEGHELARHFCKEWFDEQAEQAKAVRPPETPTWVKAWDTEVRISEAYRTKRRLDPAERIILIPEKSA